MPTALLPWCLYEQNGYKQVTALFATDYLDMVISTYQAIRKHVEVLAEHIATGRKFAPSRQPISFALHPIVYRSFVNTVAREQSFRLRMQRRS